VGYTASILLLSLSFFAIYSIPSLNSTLRFHQLDADFPVFFGVLGGVLFVGPLVIWIVRRRKFGSFRQSIWWYCGNRVLGRAFMAGFALGITYLLTKNVLLAHGYEQYGLEDIIAFVILTGLAQPAVEEVYFRGILFVALAGRVGKIQAIVIVTLLFCLGHRGHALTVLPLAAMLGGMRLYTGSVKACFACHAAYNLSLVLGMLPIDR
jgi:membrane protease YdiL (CAAX protease family)